MSIRNDIITTSPFFDLITERFSNFEAVLDALTYAIEISEVSALSGFATVAPFGDTSALQAR